MSFGSNKIGFKENYDVLYRKYKKLYLNLKTQFEGQIILDKIDFPEKKDIIEELLKEKPISIDKLWESVLMPVIETCQSIIDRNYFVHRFQKNFELIQGKDILKPYNIKLSIIDHNEQIYIIFFLSVEGIEKNRLTFELTEQPFYDFPYHIENVYSNDDKLSLRHDEKVIAAVMENWMNLILKLPIYNLPSIGQSAGRFGNIMFFIAHWISYLLDKYHHDFIIGISFVYRGGRHSRDIYFGKDLGDFFYSPIGFEEYDDFKRLLSLDDTPYKFTHKQKTEKGIIIKPRMNRSKIREFCRSYALTKNVELAKLRVLKSDIAIHFRGSDFCVTEENEPPKFGRFFVLHCKYYLRALRSLKNIPKRIIIFATPEDKYIVLMMIEYLKFFFPTTDFLTESEFIQNHISGVQINGVLELMLLISLFDTIILSNSSFSFWCGYLSSASRVMGYIRGEHECNDFIISKAYPGALDDLDVLEGWRNVFLDEPCKQYIYPCKYYWKRYPLSHFSLFAILYCLWNDKDYHPSMIWEGSEESPIIAKIIIKRVRESKEILSGTEPPFNSISNADFLKRLAYIHKSKKREELVNLIDELYYASKPNWIMSEISFPEFMREYHDSTGFT